MSNLVLPDGIDHAIEAIRHATATAAAGGVPRVHEVLTAISWARALDDALRALNPDQQWPFGWEHAPANTGDPDWMRGLAPIRNAMAHRVAAVTGEGVTFPVTFPLTFDAYWVPVEHMGPWPEKRFPKRDQLAAFARHHEGEHLQWTARILARWAEHLASLPRQR